MAGQIKRMIDEIIAQRSRGNDTIRITTRTKLLLKGLNPDSYTATSYDDPAIMAKVKKVAKELGVSL